MPDTLIMMAKALRDKEEALLKGGHPVAEYLQEALNLIGRGVVITNMEGRFIHWNVIAATLLGIDNNKINDKSSNWSGVYQPRNIDGTPVKNEELPGVIVLATGKPSTKELVFFNGYRKVRAVFEVHPLNLHGTQCGAVFFIQERRDE